MSGIYIHIPFCRQKCHYCNFFSVASGKYREQFAETVQKEIALHKDYLSGETVETIYFGGGTPSLFAPFEIKHILDEIKKFHHVADDAEITLEANPDDLDQEKLHKYLTAGINRLSIGIQSFYDEDLEYLNRIHSAQRAEDCVKEAQQAGFSNISIDLIYGIPGLTEEKWKNNISKAIALGAPHISAYALTVEPKTPLDVMIRQNKMAPVDEEQTALHFRILQVMMKQAGYEHYEISNFCRDGLYSRHNTGYWKGKKYLGLGPSAHSYDGISRQWNVSSVSKYSEKINDGQPEFEREILTENDKYNEFVMVSVRTMWGCSISEIESKCGSGAASYFKNGASEFISRGWMFEKEGVYFLTDEGKFYADGIAAALFLEPEDGAER